MLAKMEMSAALLVFGVVVLIALGVLLTLAAQWARPQAADDRAARNKALVQQSFDAWAAGTGGPFELLADEADWTIVGRSLVAKTYPDREAFMSEVIGPFNARMSTPLKPTVRRIHAEGDTVIVLFDAASTVRDGLPYTNTYTWYLTFRGDRVVSATAFFDSIAFDEMWLRVEPTG